VWKPVVSDHVENIESRGVHRRRTAGIAFFVVGFVAAALLVVFRVAHPWRLALVLPFAAGASGLLQARERT
jgi:uncharacterized membrane protein YccC